MKAPTRLRLFGARGIVVVLSSALLLALAILPALAVHDLKFQLDGNTDQASYPGGTIASQPVDWQTFFDGSGVGGSIAAKTATLPSNFTAVGFAAEPEADLSTQEAGDYQLPDKTVFATGSKDTLDISPGWQCKKANNVGDKVDIVNAYSAVYIDPSSGDQILYFGIEKSSPNGDSNIAVWFLQDEVECSSSGGGNVPFTGHHKEGDLLVVSAFTNGGSVANVAAYAWEGGDGAAGHLSASPVAQGGTCGAADQPTTDNDLTACAITNSTSSITPPWKHPDKDGGALNALEFFEGGVDMTAAGLTNTCFARFLANTRSSQSTTATIFDFATGELAICAPSTDLSAAVTSSAGSTVHYGDSVTLQFSEENDGNTALTLAFTGRTTLTKYVTTDSTACNSAPVTYVSGDAGTANGVLDPGETWVYECTFNVPNSGTSVTVNAFGHGYDPQGHDVTTSASCVDSASVLCDADETASVSLTLINPTTALSKHVAAEVTYTYRETNDGNDPLDSVSVSDPGCTDNGGSIDASLNTSGDNVGDTDGNGALDPGETWVFTCTISVSGTSAGVDITNVATGSGTDSLGEVVTFCPTIGVTPSNTICDNQEVDASRVRLQDLARPAPTAAPTP